MEQCVNNLKVTSASGTHLWCQLHATSAQFSTAELAYVYWSQFYLFTVSHMFYQDLLLVYRNASNHWERFQKTVPEQHFWEAMLRSTSVHFGDAIFDWIAFEDTTLRKKTRKSPKCNSAACCFLRAARKLKWKAFIYNVITTTLLAILVTGNKLFRK